MSFISSWTQGIIVSVIIATIIEMILPNGSGSKYVKVVVGVFVLFNIISPVVNKFKLGSAVELNDFASMEVNSNSIGTNSSNDLNKVNLNNEEVIKNIYNENLKVDIKSKISQKGYAVGDINLEILNDNQYTLNKIELKITGKNQNATNNVESRQSTATIVENIQNIKISLGGSSNDKDTKEPSVINETEKRKLKEYLSSVYEVKEENIIIS